MYPGLSVAFLKSTFSFGSAVSISAKVIHSPGSEAFGAAGAGLGSATGGGGFGGSPCGRLGVWGTSGFCGAVSDDCLVRFENCLTNFFLIRAIGPGPFSPVSSLPSVGRVPGSEPPPAGASLFGLPSSAGVPRGGFPPAEVRRTTLPAAKVRLTALPAAGLPFVGSPPGEGAMTGSPAACSDPCVTCCGVSVLGSVVGFCAGAVLVDFVELSGFLYVKVYTANPAAVRGCLLPHREFFHGGRRRDWRYSAILARAIFLSGRFRRHVCRSESLCGARISKAWEIRVLSAVAYRRRVLPMPRRGVDIQSLIQKIVEFQVRAIVVFHIEILPEPIGPVFLIFLKERIRWTAPVFSYDRFRKAPPGRVPVIISGQFIRKFIRI